MPHSYYIFYCIVSMKDHLIWWSFCYSKQPYADFQILTFAYADYKALTFEM